MKERFFFFVVFFLLVPFLVFSAPSVTDEGYEVSETEEAESEDDDEIYTIPLPDGYLSVHLGMSPDEVKAALLLYPVFGYRGERDVSILPGFDRLLIETTGDGYLDRCWFQFYSDQLYTISININTHEMDYYSVFRTLCRKYGAPGSFSPEKAVWKDEKVIMSLEKPLCIKYSDVGILESLENSSYVEESVTEKLREDFLNSL
ncbi:MAG: hypothetical protein K5930_08365 [Treponemataceae bacterium]|nr:hypothetical protein [Treponemataceae bacterium]